MSKKHFFTWSLLIFLNSAQAAYPSDNEISVYVDAYKAQRISAGLGDNLTLEEARYAQTKLTALLPAVLGKPIGYKAAFTNPALWARFKVGGPQWGRMFEKYMLRSGSRVTSQLGARPLYEADMVAIVKDSKLATAQTPLEALKYISYFAPFIELPDAMRETDAEGPALVATNIGFRGGVVGSRIEVQPTQYFLDSLASMIVVTTEEKSGVEISRSKGSAILDNPANAALWLAKELRDSGVLVKPGDILSLGSFNAPVPPQPNTTITVRFLGLPNNPSVTVNFD